VLYFKGSLPDMTLSNTSVHQSLLNFTSSFTEKYQEQHGQLPTVVADREWLSPCEQGPSNAEENYWKPMLIHDNLMFNNVEEAMSIVLHDDFKKYFTCIYSESIDASCSEGELSLLFPWSKDDFERLQQNIIGHIMMKQRLKQNITLFFAVTDEEDMIISIDNQSGEVWVEQVGCQPHKKLANNVTEFIESLSVVV
jgi:SecY interacting protein Syd